MTPLKSSNPSDDIAAAAQKAFQCLKQSAAPGATCRDKATRYALALAVNELLDIDCRTLDDLWVKARVGRALVAAGEFELADGAVGRDLLFQMGLLAGEIRRVRGDEDDSDNGFSAVG